MTKELKVVKENRLVAGENNFDTRKVVNTLEGLMTRVTENECTAQTVHAACNCASQITNILKIHLDHMRLTRELDKTNG